MQGVYGDYPNPTIEFLAYHHYGWPGFSNYINSLLFVSQHNGKFYHEKYLYNDVYATIDGRWASPFNDTYLQITPEKISFIGELSYPAKIKDEEGHVYTIRYPEPYFKTVGDKAVAVYGNYIDELFKQTKDGVLTARGLFGDGDAYDVEIIDTQMAELRRFKIISPSDSALLSKTWEGVMTA